MAWVEMGVLAYGGLGCLARANHRFRPAPLGGGVLVRTGPAILVGWLLLAAGLAVAVAALGPAQGIVAFLCLVSVIGIALILMLSVQPTVALAPTFLLPGTRRRRG